MVIPFLTAKVTIDKNARVKSVPVTSVRALSDTTISFVSLFLKRRILRTGTIAAGSVEARIAPSRTPVHTVIVVLSAAPVPTVTYANKNAVRSSPGKERSAIFGNNRLKLAKGVSRPPPKRISVAPIATSTLSIFPFCATSIVSRNGFAAMPKNIAITNDGMCIFFAR